MAYQPAGLRPRPDVEMKACNNKQHEVLSPLLDDVSGKPVATCLLHRMQTNIRSYQLRWSNSDNDQSEQELQEEIRTHYLGVMKVWKATVKERYGEVELDGPVQKIEDMIRDNAITTELRDKKHEIMTANGLAAHPGINSANTANDSQTNTDTNHTDEAVIVDLTESDKGEASNALKSVEERHPIDEGWETVGVRATRNVTPCGRPWSQQPDAKAGAAVRMSEPKAEPTEHILSLLMRSGIMESMSMTPTIKSIDAGKVQQMVRVFGKLADVLGAEEACHYLRGGGKHISDDDSADRWALAMNLLVKNALL